VQDAPWLCPPFPASDKSANVAQENSSSWASSASWQLDQIARGLDGGVLAEDVGVASGRDRSLRGLVGRSVWRRSPSEIESELDVRLVASQTSRSVEGQVYESLC
jgi:hypothetical protein